MYQLEVHSKFELVVGLDKALSGLIILSLWEESLCVLYSAQALTNQSAAYIFHNQSESKIWCSVCFPILVPSADSPLIFQYLVCKQ